MNVIRRNGLITFLLLLPSAIGFTFSLHILAGEPQPPPLAWLGVAASLVVGVLVVLVSRRTRLFWNAEGVTDRPLLREPVLHYWSDLADTAPDQCGGTLVFSTGLIEVKDEDLRGSRLIAEALRRLGRELEAPLPKHVADVALIFGGTKGPMRTELMNFAIFPALLLGPIIRKVTTLPGAHVLFLLVLIVIVYTVHISLSWGVDDKGIARRRFGVVTQRIDWSEVDFLTREGLKGVLWSGARAFEFELLSENGRSLFDEVQARVPSSTPLYSAGLVSLHQKLAVEFGASRDV